MRLLAIAALLGVALATTRYDGYKVFQLTPTASQLELLTQFENSDGYDIWSRNRKAGAPLDIMVSPLEVPKFSKFLRSRKIENTITIEDVQTVFDEEKGRLESTPRVEGKITFDRYYNHSEVNAYLDEMAATYPSIATVEIIGQSFEGRDIKILKISSGGTNRPIVWIDAGIHAREWIAPAMALYTINQLLEVTGNEDLYENRDWWILPVVNADGYDFTFSNNRLWRKTRSIRDGESCIGVDPNRNWDFHWNEIGASQNPCDSIYSGPFAFSEPECVHMRDVILDAQDRIMIYISFHSYGNYFLYGWGWTEVLPDDWEILDELAVRADAAQQAAGGSPYEIGSSTIVLYAAAGASDDWAKGVANISLSYTIELPGGGLTGFDMPPTRIQETVSQFFPAVRVLGEAV